MLRAAQAPTPGVCTGRCAHTRAGTKVASQATTHGPFSQPSSLPVSRSLVPHRPGDMQTPPPHLAPPGGSCWAQLDANWGLFKQNAPSMMPCSGPPKNSHLASAARRGPMCKLSWAQPPLCTPPSGARRASCPLLALPLRGTPWRTSPCSAAVLLGCRLPPTHPTPRPQALVPRVSEA